MPVHRTGATEATLHTPAGEALEHRLDQPDTRGKPLLMPDIPKIPTIPSTQKEKKSRKGYGAWEFSY